MLVDSLLELYRDPKWRVDTSFKNGYLQKLQNMLKAKLPTSRILANPHIESRIKTLKGKFVALDDAISQSGFGWNKQTKTLVCERTVFDEWAKVTFLFIIFCFMFLYYGDMVLDTEN